MARPKSYDRSEAVERACMAFWRHGYQALGVRELERLTGLNQFAIRTEFGGKEGLFLEALKHYSNAAIETAMSPLVTGGTAEIVAFLRNLVTAGSMTSSSAGCLIVNTGIENARIGSAKLDETVRRYWTTLGERFGQALRNAREAGRIPPDTDIEKIADGLVTAVMGVHACNRNARAHDAGKALVDLICTCVEQLETP